MLLTVGLAATSCRKIRNEEGTSQGRIQGGGAGGGRTFSALRVIKNHLRSTMGEARLSGLATIYIHNRRAVDLDKVIDIFSAKSRRLTL